MSSLSIIIPNYNGGKTILNTIRSVSQQAPGAQIIVYDDCSTDNSRLLVSTRYPTVHIIGNTRNRGAAFTRNAAFNHADGDIIVCIDADVVLNRGSLKRLLNSNCDIAFPRVSYPNGIVMYPAKKTDSDYLLVSPVFAIKRSALERVGFPLFDEYYCIYGEDTDFFLKCYLCGLTCEFVSAANAVHHASKPSNRENRYYLELRNSIYGLVKFRGFPLSKFDHAFRMKNLLQLMACGLFNYNVFDAQLRGYDKRVNGLNKIRRLLSPDATISEKGFFRMLSLTCRGIYAGFQSCRQANRSRAKLQQIIVGQSTIHKSMRSA